MAFPAVYQLRRLDARGGVKWHQSPAGADKQSYISVPLCTYSECHDSVTIPSIVYSGRQSEWTQEIYISSLGMNPDQDQEQTSDILFSQGGAVWSAGLSLVDDNSLNLDFSWG